MAMQRFGEDYETRPQRVEVLFHDGDESLERMARMVSEAVDHCLVAFDTAFSTQPSGLGAGRIGVVRSASEPPGLVVPRGHALVRFPAGDGEKVGHFEVLSLIEVNRRLRPAT